MNDQDKRGILERLLQIRGFINETSTPGKEAAALLDRHINALKQNRRWLWLVDLLKQVREAIDTSTDEGNELLFDVDEQIEWLEIPDGKALYRLNHCTICEDHVVPELKTSMVTEEVDEEYATAIFQIDALCPNCGRAVWRSLLDIEGQEVLRYKPMQSRNDHSK
jgi:uncharacterized protein with PIN domain